MLSSSRVQALSAAIAASMLAPPPAAAAPVLREAGAQVRFESPLACAVALTFTVLDAAKVEHRLELPAGATVSRLDVMQAAADAPHDIGRTRAVVVTPSAVGAPYTLRYEVRQGVQRSYRCPLWLPTVPTDGRSRVVRITVEIPAGTTVVGGMPSFTWHDARGDVRLAHLPAFVVVPFADATAPRPWDVSRVMDTVALGTLAVASVAFLARQRGRR